MRRWWLAPLVPIYAVASAVNAWAYDAGLLRVRRLALPVVSVGNLSAGGAGKTPFVIALVALLRESGLSVDVLSRGYGRSSRDVERDAARVDVFGTAEDFGDEPLLIAREAAVPVFVGAQRYEAGLLAESLSGGAGHIPQIHILDDGFQHRRLGRDLDIVLVSSADLEDALLPAGNRREPLTALRRAHVLAVPDEDVAVIARLREMGFAQPVVRVQREMDVPDDVLDVGRPVVAFCGIARPEQFFDGLEEAGAVVAARLMFGDHRRYEDADVERLVNAARRVGAKAFVTTAKDFVRMGQVVARLEAVAPVRVVGLRSVILDVNVLINSLGNVLAG